VIPVGAWPAPAKLNLMLRIVGRRADGYHLLQSVFQFIDLVDELSFGIRNDGVIRRVSGPADVAPDDDLVVRAARLLKQHCGTDSGVDIEIDKRIPMGAGLGGGSSNAATTLVALNDLWGCGLKEGALMQLGVELGADVPVFIHGHAAWAEGVGEQLTDMELPETSYLLVLPGCHVDTGKVFQDPELTRNSARITIRDFLAGEHGNDCTAVVRKRHSQVAQALDWLAEFAPARMTGTGSSVFAEFADEAAAQLALREVPAPMTGIVVRGKNRSPLHQKLASG
jgi:4-diphosphocytidyl-2-C-methyl-D-erythritol kinase